MRTVPVLVSVLASFFLAAAGARPAPAQPPPDDAQPTEQPEPPSAPEAPPSPDAAAPSPEPAPPSVESATTPIKTAPTPAPPGATTPATPAEPPAPVAGGEYREIHGHWFVVPFAVKSAVMNGSFSFAQGFGSLSSGPARLFLYDQALKAQIGIVNRVAVELEARGRAAVAGNVDTLLALPALATLRIGGFPKVRVFTLDTIGLQLAVGAGVYYLRDVVISPYSAVAAEDPSQLFLQSQGFEVTPALMVAEGLGPVGLQVSVAPTITRASQVGVADSTTTSAGLEAGTHLAFDIGRLTSYFPVAIAVEYGIAASFKAGEKPENSIGGGVYYSGRRDFSIGALANATLVGGDPGLTFFYGSLAFQYYF